MKADKGKPDYCAVNQYQITDPVKVIAVCGPSASGKSTFIEMLLGGRETLFGRIPIVLTRSERKGETSKERICVSEPEFEQMALNNELCLAGRLYGFLTGARRIDVLNIVASGVVIVIDPNNFYRLHLLKSLFPKADLLDIHFLPLSISKLRGMDDMAIRELYDRRITSRESIPPKERFLRVEDCLSTIRIACENPPQHVVINDLVRSKEEVYAEMCAIISRRFKNLLP